MTARLHAPEAERPLLRRLRIRHFSGQLLDEPETIRGAARDAVIDPSDLERWSAEPAVQEALSEDTAAARHPDERGARPRRQARQLVGRAALHVRSYEIARTADGVRIAVPGFQPFAVYDVVTANLVPGSDRRDPPDSVEEVLRWTGTPLASKEVAVCATSRCKTPARRSATWPTRSMSGFDGFWTLNGA